MLLLSNALIQAAKVMSIKTLTLSRCIKYFQYGYKDEDTERQTA